MLSLFRELGLTEDQIGRSGFRLFDNGFGDQPGLNAAQRAADLARFCVEVKERARP